MQLRRLALAGAVSGLIMLVTTPVAPAVSPLALLAAITPSPTPTPAPAPQGPRSYKLPYAGGTSWDVCQGNNHPGWTHVGLAAYAWDFCMPVGTPILAARGGTVLAVRQDSNTGGWGPMFASAANFIVVDHGDGTSGLYMHLMHLGARVKVGDQVSTGQLIAYSGNTGWTSAPHLHFMVMKTDKEDFYTQSVPVLFLDVPTNGGLPLEDNSYTSGNASVDAKYATPSGPPPFAPFWVESFRATTLWSGTDDKAVSFGPAPAWSYFQVAAPQTGPRLQVTVAGTGAPAFVVAADVGPSGPPPNSPPGASTTAPAAASGQQQVVVQPGDTLFSLAKANQVSVDQLVAANNFADPNKLTAGQVLLLPGGSAAAPAPPPAAAPASPPASPTPGLAAKPVTGQVTVAAGDTLSSIARANQVSVDKIISANGLKDPNAITVGQVLKLS